MPQLPNTFVARAQVADAIAKVHEAMSLAEENEIHHALSAEPCEGDHTAEDAAFRRALLTSEDAMISVLESLGATPNVPAMLVN